jgi:hypothetical protein
LVDVFHELRLPPAYSRGARGGHNWQTRVVERKSGHEDRNKDFDQDRARWTIGHLIKSEEAAEEIGAFHDNRGGMATGFRYKWWRDFRALKTFQIVADGATPTFQLKRTYADLIRGTAQAGTASTITLQASQPEWLFHAVDDTYNGKIIRTTAGTGAGQMRLISDYTGASKVADVAPNWTVTPDVTTKYEIELFIYQRDVLKPVLDFDTTPVTIYVNDISVTFTIDYTTGLYTPSVEPSSGDVLAADEEYDHPVRFNSDFQNWSWHDRKRHDWSGIGLIEVKDLT